ncbi:hypothetical protein OSB04_029467 [Centaurea solstitialis]|uniref:Retrovirus-related Pol polyprotein from transposon TNT 1-94-like beta-barrel domain-containing protein n=1 Tax=Centaurea solstitialis TaxID=347529 RepID=A0AA38WC59_9ASTR|nr:hypothetical protein OSB04_029467 [Centaurea solstitialis]
MEMKNDCRSGGGVDGGRTSATVERRRRWWVCGGGGVNGLRGKLKNQCAVAVYPPQAFRNHLRSNISRIYTMYKSFQYGEQQDQSLTNHVMEFKKVYEELNSLLLLSADAKAMQAKRGQVAVINFLTGLRLEYDFIRSQETFAHVLRNKSVQPSPNPEHNSALVSRGGFHGGFRGGSRGGHRGGTKGGHTGRTTEPHTTIPDSDIDECYYCHELGHTKRACKMLLAQYPRSSSAHVASALDSTVTIPAKEYAQLLGTEYSTAPTVAFVETGASDHMTGNPTLFSTFDKHMSPSHATIADGSTSFVLGSGTIELTLFVSLSFVLSLPKFSFNLLSVSRITHALKCCIIGRGREADSLYIFEHQQPRSLACSNSSSPLEVHCRLGHPYLWNLKKLCPNVSLVSFPNISVFIVCNKRVLSPFELAHSDIWGPCPVTSKLGFKYFVTFVDDYSRTTWLYFMKNRSEVFTNFCSL